MPRFVSTAAAFYFSGGLLVPAAYLHIVNGTRAALLAWTLVILYFGLGTSAYFLAQKNIMHQLARRRETLLRESADKLRRLYDEGGSVQDLEREQSRQRAILAMRHSLLYRSNATRAGVQVVLSGIPSVLAAISVEDAWLKALADWITKLTGIF